MDCAKNTLIINERQIWIDYAKLISICLVVSFHTPPRPDGFLGDFMSMLRMPAFFLIAGLLFKAEKYTTFGNFLRHRGIQLLIPYASFFFIFYIFWILFGRMLAGADEMAIHPLLPLWEFITGNPKIVIAPCWFLCCLFSIQTIYYLISKHLSRNAVIVIVLLFPFLNCISNLSYLPWGLSQAFQYMPFYAIPNLMRKHIISSETSKWSFAFISLVIGMGCLFFLIELRNPWADTLATTLSGLLILPFYIQLCKAIAMWRPFNRFAEFIGRNTIIILAIQNYIIGFIKIFCISIFGPDFFVENYMANIAITTCVLIVSTLPIVFINKYIPGMIGRGDYFNRFTIHIKGL